MGLPLLLAVACGLAWSAHDTLRKLLVARIRPLPLLVLLAAGSAPPFLAWLLLAPAQRTLPSPSYWLPAAASVALNVAANLALLRGMRLAPLSLAVPLLSLTPAFATLVAIPLLHEIPTPLDSLGILLVVAGAISLGRGAVSRRPDDRAARPHTAAQPVEAVPRGSSERAPAIPPAGDPDPARSGVQARAPHPAVLRARAGTPGDRLHRPTTPGGRAASTPAGYAASATASAHREGTLWMTLTALAWSLTPALDKLALTASSPAFHALVLTAGVALAVLAILAAAGRARELAGVARVPGVFALAVISSTLALGLQLLAFQLLWVGLVETLKRGIGNLMSLALGRAVFGERPGWAALAAVLGMAAGVALILGT